jgi:alkanesulfonate monooxygenase SsuD/methylene tetrahydromethanopterin reductase-like flavin-dependent oxidoreductase (luciferase family)
MATHVIGDPETVVNGLSRLQERTSADEIIVSTRLHSLEARLESHALLAAAWGMTD